MTRQHYVYRIKNASTGEYYIGKRTCSCEISDDGYMGSGKRLKRAMNARPEDGWVKEILMICESEEEAYDVEEAAVGDRWDTDPLCLNLVGGGDGMRSFSAQVYWADPCYRRKTCEGMLRGWVNNQDRRRNASKTSARNWKDNDYRTRATNNMKKVKRTPQSKARTSELAKQRWKDPICREAMIEGIRAFQKPIRLILNEEPLIITDISELLNYLEQGYTFQSRVVRINNPTTKQYSEVVAHRAKEILLRRDGWEYGYRGDYEKVSARSIT